MSSRTRSTTRAGSATATPTPSPCLTSPLLTPDHYLCYDVKTTKSVCEQDGSVCKNDKDCGCAKGSCVKLRPPRITDRFLEDQFESGRVRIGKPERLCTPVDKTFEGQTVCARDREGTHFEAYQIQRAGDPVEILFPPPDCAPCQGGITSLDLFYLGEQQANLLITDEFGVIVHSTVPLDPSKGRVIQVRQIDPESRELRVDITIPTVPINEVIRLDTTCDKPIGPGLAVGTFLRIVAGESLQGGPLCPVVEIANQLDELFLDVGDTKSLMVPTAKRRELPLPILEEDIDHYRCYEIRSFLGRERPLAVSLRDQFFDDLAFDVRRPRYLCNPAAKDGGELLSPEDHLVCYDLRPAPGICSAGERAGEACKKDQDCGDEKDSGLCVPRPKAEAKNIQGLFLTNQFGDERLDLQAIRELCVPSEKTLGFEAPPSPPDTPTPPPGQPIPPTEPTATPTATATSTPTPTATSTPTATATSTATATATATPSPTATPVEPPETPTSTPSATATATPTATATATATPTASPTATATTAVEPRDTPTPTPSATPTATPTPTETPTSTPTTTNTPTPAGHLSCCDADPGFFGFCQDIEGTDDDPQACSASVDSSGEVFSGCGNGSIDIISCSLNGGSLIDAECTQEVAEFVALNGCFAF